MVSESLPKNSFFILYCNVSVVDATFFRLLLMKMNVLEHIQTYLFSLLFSFLFFFSVIVYDF
jgi:hypothetical protein